MEKSFFIDKQGDPTKSGPRSKKPLRIDEICHPHLVLSAISPVKPFSRASKKQKISKPFFTGPPTKATSKPIISDIWNSSKTSSVRLEICKKPINEALHPGASYNPSKKHHTEALAMAIVREVNRESNKEIHFQKNAPNSPVSLVSLTSDEQDASLTDFHFQDPSLANDLEACNAPESQVVNSRQTQRVSQSKRAARQRERECIQNATKRKELRKLHSQIDNIQELSSQICAKGKGKEASETKMSRKMPKKFENPIFPVFLSSELPPSLRAIGCSATAPFVDQFKRLQERRLIEVRTPSLKKRRKYPLRTYEKRSYKNFELTNAGPQLSPS